MAFHPLQEKGIPFERQVRNWDELNVDPYDKNGVHPYTRTRIILMNGIEVEAALFGHQMARQADAYDLKQKLAQVRRIEQQQQKAINWLIPADESPLEVTLGYEQAAVDLTAWLAQTEPEENVRNALDFALIEDFDHLYRYSNLMGLMDGKDPAQVVGELTEIFPGRPTIAEHRHPFDSIRHHYDKDRADVLTKLHVLTIVAGEQQTMNFYMNVGNRPEISVGRGLYQEIAQIEEQHVSHYESLADPRESSFERLLLHEYNECYLYYSFVQEETDERIRDIWQNHLDYEIEHLHLAAELLEQYEGRDAESLLPAELPELIRFQPNKQYIRNILASGIDLTADGNMYTPVEALPDSARYFTWQRLVNVDGSTPSQRVIEEHIDRHGTDYRLETEGPHPVEELRDRARAPAGNLSPVAPQAIKT
jgi:rubrerythrin